MVSVREIAKSMVIHTADTLCKDATYIPEDKLDWKPTDCSKSARAIVAECAKVNLMAAAAIKGESFKESEEAKDFAALKSYVMDTAQAVCNAIDSLSDTALEDQITMPWGATMTATEVILLAASHMSYHDGQINYIQVLLGDTKFHWAEG